MGAASAALFFVQVLTYILKPVFPKLTAETMIFSDKGKYMATTKHNSSTTGGSSSRTTSGSNSSSTSDTSNIQLSGSSSSTVGGSHSETSTVGGSDTYSHSEGGSHSESYGKNRSTTESQSSSAGGATSQQAGKSWASGEVDQDTLNARKQYNQGYVEDPKVMETYNRLQDTINNRPGAFSSRWDSTLSDIYDQLVNGQKFNYNFNQDALYRLYAKQYQQKGKTAMQDTLGQASAMSGGYSNSYAQSVAQQQYQNYLQQLNDRIPELQQQAYQRYLADRADLRDQFSMAGQLRSNEYQQYRDTVSDWQSDRVFDQSAYQDARNFDRSNWNQDRSYWQQEYWNQRNAEQSNASMGQQQNWQDTRGLSNTQGESQSVTDSRNWQDTVSHTDSWSNSTTDTSSWSNTNTLGWSIGNSHTDQSSQQTGWSNTDSSNWSNTTGSSISDGGGSGGSGSASGSSAPNMGWVQANDYAVQSGAPTSNQSTIQRNQMERQLSNIGSKDAQRNKIMQWYKNNRIDENDAVYLADKYKIKF